MEMVWPSKPRLYKTVYNEAEHMVFHTEYEKTVWIVREYISRGGKYYQHDEKGV